MTKKKFDTRPKKQTVVKGHSRTTAGKTVAVREHIRIIVGDHIKSFKVTTKEEADNAEVFSWKHFEKISHLNPTVVEMAPEDFLILTAEYHDPEFEMVFPEKFEEQNKKRIKLIDKYAKMFEKLKKAPFVHLTVSKDGKVWGGMHDGRHRVQALKELGYGTIPVVVLEDKQ
ncbi:unnamed protein product, partial [marine sediment metagenome]